MSFIKEIIKPNHQKRIILFLLVDILLISLSVCLAFLFRFDGRIPSEYFPIIQRVIILSLIFCLPIFYFSKLYSFSWSYVSAEEIISLSRAVVLSFLCIGLSIFILRGYSFFPGLPRSTLFISFILVFLFCGGIRLAKRIYLQVSTRNFKEAKQRTLIVGAGDAGEQILRSILISNNSPYLTVGFVDDNSNKRGEIIHGVRVLGDIDNIPEIIERKQIEGMIIALPSAGSKIIKNAVDLGRKSGVKRIKIIPPMTEIIEGEISIKDIREVQIEDLLGREPISLNTKLIEDFIRGKVILITGAAGSIGSELSRQVAKFNPSLLLILDQDESGIFSILEELKDKFVNVKTVPIIADIQEKEKIDYVFRNFHPNIVFHAAAYKHVPLMEECPEEAVKNNIFGTKIVGQLAIKHGVEKFIFISTDKAINPTSVMGATKRVGEMICQVLNKMNHTEFISVRFGNVLDSRGSVIPIFREQIKKGGPVEVTHPEMKRYFMMTSESCLLVMQAANMGRGGEVFVLDMGEPIKILDLAREMIRLSGLEPDKDIPIVFTGVRPGEKFFEEILTSEEGTIATQHQKIFMAKLSEVNEIKLKEDLDKLKETVRQPDREQIIYILKKIVLTYSPRKFQPFLNH